MCKIIDYTSSLSNKWITLAIGCLQCISTGPTYAIAAATQDIMSTFDMTESQYGLIATMYLTGSLLTFLPGTLLDRYGPVPVSVISLIGTLFSYGSIWQLAKLEPFPAQQYLLYVSFFCAGLSIAGQGSVALKINLSNFKKSTHGKVTGLLGCSIFIGGAIFTQLYTGLFSPNLSDFFLLVMIYSSTVWLLTIFFVGTFNKDNSYDIMDPDQPSNGMSGDHMCENNPLKTLEFYVLLGVHIFLISGANVLLFMTSLYTESLGLGKYSTGLLTMSTIVTSLSDLAIGILSDFMLEKIPRMKIALIITIGRALAVFIAIFQIQHISVLVLLMLINAVIFSIQDLMIPSELHECFGDKHFGKIFGTFTTSNGFATMALQYFTTWFYQKERRKQESTDEWCHGKTCVLPGVLLIFILNVIALVLMLIYLYRRKASRGNIYQREDLNQLNEY